MSKDMYNAPTIKKSQNCGCLYCHALFACSEIKEWTDEDQTAFCPRCGIDRVVGDFNYDLEKVRKAAWRAKKEGRDY